MNKRKSKNRRISPILLLCTVIAISLISTSNLFIFTDLFLANALNSKPAITEQSISAKQQEQQQHKVIEASGHFANNQIQNGSVTWIQGGLWNLTVSNNSSFPNSVSENTSASVGSSQAAFSADFTMVKPDGGESHGHSINNFVSNNVIVAGGDMVITGIGDIFSDGVLKFKQVPITVHLMGKHHVLGLIMDTVKTENHFASTHEMFGTLITGTGLDKIEKTLPTSKEQLSGKGMNMTMSIG